jgi:thiamine pyrophosphokinase
MSSQFPDEELRHNKLVMGVDGGVWSEYLSLYDITLGDGDSLKTPLSLDHHYSVDKNESDLALALKLLPPDLSSIELWGFWGGRDDHQLLNLGEIFHWHNRQAIVTIYRPENSPVRLYPAGVHKIISRQTFSLLSFEEAHFSIQGECRWPLSRTKVQKLSSHLLSNEGQGEMTIECDQKFFCFEEAP